MTEMKKMKTLTLQGIPFEVVDEAARNEIEDVKETLNSLPKNEVSTPDLAQNDPSAPDYVKNRTHYEETTVVNEPLNITWDGNTEGLVSVVDEWGLVYCKVSDATPTIEQLFNGGSFIAKYWEDSPYLLSSDLVNLSDNENVALFLQKDNIGLAVAYSDEAGLEGITFPEKGLYFTVSYAYEEPAYILSFTTTEPVEHIKTVVKKLDKKYLPDDIGGGYTIFYVDFADEKIYIDESIETEANSVDVETALSKGVIYFKKAYTGELYNSFELETGDSGYYIRILTMNYGNVNVQSVATSDFIGGAD